jgi:ribonuclease D
VEIDGKGVDVSGLGDSGTAGTPQDPWVPQKITISAIDKKCAKEFATGVPGVPNSPTGPLDVPLPTLRLVTDYADLGGIAETLRSAAQPVALDLETYGSGKWDALDPLKGDIRLLTLAIPGHQPWLLDLQAIGYDLGPLKPVLETLEIIGHNVKFDALWLAVKCDLRLAKLFCTQNASRLLTNGTDQKNDLGECLRRYLGVDLPKDQAKSAWGAAVLSPEQLDYARNDVAHLHTLKAALEAVLAKESLTDVARLEMELLPVVVAMEARGFAIDREKLRHIQQQACTQAEALKAAIQRDMADPAFNPNSTQQILEKLHGQGVTLPNTKEETLAACKHCLTARSKLLPRSLAVR